MKFGPPMERKYVGGRDGEGEGEDIVLDVVGARRRKSEERYVKCLVMNGEDRRARKMERRKEKDHRMCIR